MRVRLYTCDIGELGTEEFTAVRLKRNYSDQRCTDGERPQGARGGGWEEEETLQGSREREGDAGTRC